MECQHTSCFELVRFYSPLCCGQSRQSPNAERRRGNGASQEKFWDLQREEVVEVSAMRVADFRPGTEYLDADPWGYTPLIVH